MIYNNISHNVQFNLIYSPSITGSQYLIHGIIEGKINPASFSPEKLKYRLTVEGHLEECCGNCGFTEHRVTDHKVPLILHFKDKNKLNYNLSNIEFLCYNCYFYLSGNLNGSTSRIQDDEEDDETYENE